MLRLAFLAFVSAALAAPSYGPSFEIDPYVVNGTDSNIAKFPWMVSIRASNSHNCGGSIISATYCLSAAHCSGETVQYGATQITRTGDNIIRVARWIRHGSYSSSTLRNDVAIVQLESPIPLGPTARPVKMPQRFREVEGNWVTPAILTGYGLDRTGGVIKEILQEVRLLVASNAHCRSAHTNTVYDDMLCAGVPEGGKGQCSGDSGGPLVLEDGTLVGAVSWSVKPCTVVGYPGVYSKVSHFVDWVEQQTGLKFD